MSAVHLPVLEPIVLPTFTVFSAPRTKKTHSRIIWLKTKGWSAKVARLSAGLEGIVADHPLSREQQDTLNQVIQIVKDSGDGTPLLMPSETYMQWFKGAMWQAPEICRQLRRESVQLPIKQPVSVRALFFRDRRSGDACGFYQALGDWLQAPRLSTKKLGKLSRDGAGIIADDSLIADWNGSMLLKDAANPRIEVTIQILPGAQPELELQEEW